MSLSDIRGHSLPGFPGAESGWRHFLGREVVNRMLESVSCAREAFFDAALAWSFVDVFPQFTKYFSFDRPTKGVRCLLSPGLFLICA
jgi:hypothetical protein